MFFFVRRKKWKRWAFGATQLRIVEVTCCSMGLQTDRLIGISVERRMAVSSQTEYGSLDSYRDSTPGLFTLSDRRGFPPGLAPLLAPRETNLVVLRPGMPAVGPGWFDKFPMMSMACLANSKISLVFR